MTISFNEISAFIRTPGFFVEFDNSQANQGLVREASRVLLIGQMLASGSAVAGVPVRVTAPAQAVILGGRGSMLAHMVAAFKGANEDTDLWVLPIADTSSGTAATGKITVSGPATAAGTLALYLGGRRVQVAVAAGAAADDIAGDIIGAISANADLPVLAVADANPSTIKLTARHKGVCGNGIDLRTSYYQGENVPAGVGIAITPFAGGAGNPDLTVAIAALGETQYHHVILPYTDGANLALVVEEFTSRWSGMRQIEGQVWTAHAGDHAALTTLGNSLNSEVLSVMSSYGSPTPAYEWAAVYAAVSAYHLDIDPARPLQTLWLKGLLAPADKDRFTRSERNLLLYDGISTFSVTQDGRALIERAITTYQVNVAGLPDPSYLDVETPATLAILRRTLRARLAQKFPRHKLAADGTNFGPGQAIVTPSIIRAELIALARDWEQAGWVERVDQFKAQLIVERNANDPTRVDAVLPPDLINQLRVFAGKVEFRL